MYILYWFLSRCEAPYVKLCKIHLFIITRGTERSTSIPECVGESELRNQGMRNQDVRNQAMRNQAVRNQAVLEELYKWS